MSEAADLSTDIRVLLVEDDEDDYTLTRDLLGDIAGTRFPLEWARSYGDGLRALEAGAFDVVLLDYRLGEGTGLDFLARMPLEETNPPVILLTGQGDRQTDLLAMQAGAADYLAKAGLNATMLERSIRYAVERHRARVAKHEAELRYQLLLQSGGAIVWQGDPTTLSFSFVSREAEHLLGYPVERWTTEPAFWADHLHPEDRPWALAYCEDAARRGQDHSFEYRMIASDGRIVWLRDIVRLVEIAGRATLAGVMVDITAAKAAEESIRLRDQAVEAISEGVVMVDARRDDYPIVYVNPAFVELTGYSREEAVGRNCRFLSGADTDPLSRAEIRAALAEERSVTLELINYRKDGTQFWNRLSISPVRDEGGQLTHFVGVQRDITERLRAVTELAAAEAHYRRLVTAAPLGVYAVDGDGRFIELNPAGERLLERTASNMLGKHFLSVVAPQDVELAREMFARAMQGAPGELAQEIRVARPSGEERLLSLTFAPVWERDCSHGVHGIARDITDERAREQHVRRVERLAGVGTLIAGVAHELNNPLSAVLGFTRLLLMDPRPDTEREDLETIARETERMAKIVSDLRLIARDTQEDTAKRQRIDLNDAVRHVLKTRDYSLRTHNIEVREELHPGLPPLLADRGQIEQVLLNLVVNAEQAMDGTRGERRLTLKTRATPDGASVQVTDTGPGIAKAHLERIFDPFFTTKAPGEGTGLGLSLVHSIIREHNGDIRVDSEPGQGTAIRIDLPAAPAETDAPSEPEAMPRNGRPLRVLVVDDEAAVRRVLLRTLQRRGHSADEAAEGRRALELLDSAPYDVVVSDLRMPGMSGDELLARLRGRGGGMEKRLIFLTGDTASPEALRILSGAEVPVLPKPAAIADVVRWVEQLGAL